MVSKKGFDGYNTDPSRMNVWGINGDPHQRGALGTRRMVKAAGSATRTEPGLLAETASLRQPSATVDLNASRSGESAAGEHVLTMCSPTRAKYSGARWTHSIVTDGSERSRWSSSARISISIHGTESCGPASLRVLQGRPGAKGR